MAIQQNVNQILSLSAVFARMSPLADMAEHRKDVEKDVEKHKKDVEKAKKAYDQQSKIVKEAEKLNSKNQIFPRDEQLSAAKRLYQLEPTEELAANIRDMERDIRERQEKVSKKKEVDSAKRDYAQKSKVVEGQDGLFTNDQIFSRKEQLSAAKRLYDVEPTKDLANKISAMEKDVKNRQDIAANHAAAESIRREQVRQRADRAREQRLKNLEGASLSPKPETTMKPKQEETK